MEELQPAANFDNTQHQRARESLYRAAATVQEMFYLFREKVVFKYPVHHIEHIGRELQIHAAKPGTPGTLSYKPKDGIVPLHEDIFSDPKDRHAVLSFMACQNPGAYLEDIILYFLKREYYPSIDNIERANEARSELCQQAHGRSSHHAQE